MEHIFYGLTFLAILYEHMKIMKPDGLKNRLDRLKSNTKSKELTIEDSKFMLLLLGYTLWAIVGLMSSQWLIFSYLFIMGFAISLINKRPPNYVIQIDSAITIILLFFMLINKYYLELNLYQELLTLFK